MMFSRVVAIAAIVLAAVAAGFGFVQHQDVGRADARLSRQARQITSLSRQVAQVGTREQALSGTVGTLNAPSDPLSAYDDVCNTQATNDSTGFTQTYWYPCTNEAQTIPQPGN
jgi:hypothetical protein